jgi:hypothetical protein
MDFQKGPLPIERGQYPRGTVMRIGNAIFWVAVLLALAIHFNALHDPSRMMGLAFIPAVMGFLIDLHLRKPKLSI